MRVVLEAWLEARAAGVGAQARVEIRVSEARWGKMCSMDVRDFWRWWRLRVCEPRVCSAARLSRCV